MQSKQSVEQLARLEAASRWDGSVGGSDELSHRALGLTAHCPTDPSDTESSLN